MYNRNLNFVCSLLYTSSCLAKYNFIDGLLIFIGFDYVVKLIIGGINA